MPEPLLDIRPDHLQIVRDILQKHVPQYEVWAFGSRAKWTAKEYSDLDLCIVSDKPLSFSVLGAMGEDFSESDLPWKVDVVDWATTSPSFRKIIERDKVVIRLGIRDGNIGTEWSNTTLGQICDAQGGAIQTGPFGSQLHTSDYKEFGIPVVMPTNIGDGGLVEDGIARIGQADVERLSQHKLRLNDIVFSRRGDVTKNALIGVRETGWLCGTGCLKVRLGDESIANAKFVSHSLRQPDIKEWLIRHAVGATMPNLNTGILSAIPIHLPPLQIQLEIAATLGALDEKISLLRETNATLEAIAQALFKSWFVNFDPVRAKAEGREPEGIPPEIAALFTSEFEDSVLGEIPKGWSVVSVGDVADVVKGKSYKSSELVESNTALVTLKSFMRGGGFRTDGFKGFSGSYKQEQVVKPGDCIVAYTDVTQQAEVIGRAAMVLPSSEHTTLVASLDVGVVRPKIEHLTTAFLYFLLRGERYVSHIFGYTSGTTVLHLAKEGLPTYQFILPPAPLLQKFEEVAIPMMEQMAGNYLQTIELASLRDRLLPRLMSGKLSLEGAVA